MFKKKKLDLEKIFQEHKHEFELLLIKDFVGYIPKEVQEPALKCFKEYGEAFERWALWQSWYINTRAINDAKKIEVYQGMMVYLKVLYTMAHINKKNYQPPQSAQMGEGVVTPKINDYLEDINFFKTNVNKITKESTDNKNEESKSTRCQLR